VIRRTLPLDAWPKPDRIAWTECASGRPATMWKLSARYNKLKQWAELAEFQSISDAADALFLGVGPAARGAFENAAAFELRRNAEDGEDDLGEVGCGIEERLGQ
jgi:hypothetical protein